MAKLLRLLVWVAVFCAIVFTFHAASSLELPRARFWIQTTATLVLEVLGIGFLVALGDMVIVPTEERENYEGSLVVVEKRKTGLWRDVSSPKPGFCF